MFPDSSGEGGHVFALDNGLLDINGAQQASQTQAYYNSASVRLEVVRCRPKQPSGPVNKGWVDIDASFEVCCKICFWLENCSATNKPKTPSDKLKAITVLQWCAVWACNGFSERHHLTSIIVCVCFWFIHLFIYFWTFKFQLLCVATSM